MNPNQPQTTPEILSRAQGCLLGQLAGDSLGSLVEFRTAEDIKRQYPDGVRKLADGGTWQTLAGQPTDDSEMALLLARMLIEKRTYDPKSALDSYVFWLASGPFDCGGTIGGALRGHPNHQSQANGAMMRISPLGIFGTNQDLGQVASWAIADAALTHPNPVCRDANALFTMAMSYAIRTGCTPGSLYQQVLTWAVERNVGSPLLDWIHEAKTIRPAEYIHQQGWVRIAFQNALWQLLHAASLEAAVVDTVMHGGDTDTNAAICGALLGAVHGRQAIPIQWTDAVLNCRPEQGKTGVHQPRPKCFWPSDALALAESLLTG